MCLGDMANFIPLMRSDFSFSLSSFLERLIIHLSLSTKLSDANSLFAFLSDNRTNFLLCLSLATLLSYSIVLSWQTVILFIVFRRQNIFQECFFLLYSPFRLARFLWFKCILSCSNNRLSVYVPYTLTANHSEWYLSGVDI